jgi:DUF1365 family protein
MHSAIYTGRLRHRRFAPREHAFSYRLFMMYVDLAELDQVFAKRWLWSVKRPALCSHACASALHRACVQSGDVLLLL